MGSMQFDPPRWMREALLKLAAETGASKASILRRVLEAGLRSMGEGPKPEAPKLDDGHDYFPPSVR